MVFSSIFSENFNKICLKLYQDIIYIIYLQWFGSSNVLWKSIIVAIECFSSKLAFFIFLVKPFLFHLICATLYMVRSGDLESVHRLFILFILSSPLCLFPPISFSPLFPPLSLLPLSLFYSFIEHVTNASVTNIMCYQIEHFTK